MLLEFTQDYCGRETAMKEYKQGDRGMFSFAQASELIRLGVAFEVDEQIEVTEIIDEKPVFIPTKTRAKKVKDDSHQ